MTNKIKYKDSSYSSITIGDEYDLTYFEEGSYFMNYNGKKFIWKDEWIEI